MVVEQSGSFLLVGQDGRFAVLEERGDRVFPLDPERQAAEDGAPATPEGMASAVGPDGWSDEASARRRFEALARRGDELARSIW